MADPSANPYIAFALAIWAGIDGINRRLDLPEPANVNLFTADDSTLKNFKKLPQSLEEAKRIAANDEFITTHIPKTILDIYCKD